MLLDSLGFQGKFPEIWDSRLKANLRNQVTTVYIVRHPERFISPWRYVFIFQSDEALAQGYISE